MKHSGKCPKCNSQDIIADAKAIDRGDHNIQFDFSVATFKNPNAFLFKGQQSTALSAWVCADCGYVEFYADVPEKIRLPDNNG